MPDVYAANLLTELAELRKRVEDLEAAVAARAPLTSASQGWRMTDMSIPTVAAGQCHIGCNDGRFFARDADGTRRIGAQGFAVSDPSVELSDAPASYNQTWAQDLAESVSSIYQSYGNGLLPSLRDAEIIES